MGCGYILQHIPTQYNVRTNANINWYICRVHGSLRMRLALMSVSLPRFGRAAFTLCTLSKYIYCTNDDNMINMPSWHFDGKCPVSKALSSYPPLTPWKIPKTLHEQFEIISFLWRIWEVLGIFREYGGKIIDRLWWLITSSYVITLGGAFLQSFPYKTHSGPKRKEERETLSMFHIRCVSMQRLQVLQV